MSEILRLTHTEIHATVNRLSTDGYCSWPVIHGETGPWGIGYTFPDHPNIPYLRYLQSNGSMSLLEYPKVTVFDCFMEPVDWLMEPVDWLMEPVDWLIEACC